MNTYMPTTDILKPICEHTKLPFISSPTTSYLAVFWHSTCLLSLNFHPIMHEKNVCKAKNKFGEIKITYTNCKHVTT